MQLNEMMSPVSITEFVAELHLQLMAYIYQLISFEVVGLFFLPFFLFSSVVDPMILLIS